MYLYNLHVQRPTSIYHAVSGNFSGTKAVEIVVSRGHALEMFRPDEENGRLDKIMYTEVFGEIRSILTFRLTSGTKDYLIVGSDSGRVVILEYNTTLNQFEHVHQETFGRSGCRRIVPGQYLASDPKGRAFMIGAIEKQKLVYILNRDSQAKLTISSPLEAHKAHTILFSMCGVDVGFENPMFATVSVDYEEDVMEDAGAGVKTLTFYELDLGLNNVVRKHSETVLPSSNLVMSVPGGSDGPSGVLVCSDGMVSYHNIGHQPIHASIPKRQNQTSGSGLMVVSYSSHKQKNLFFFLVQSEYGDLYKISLDYNGDVVREVKIGYFDTIPVTNSLTVLKNGFLFAASEFGDHGLYHFHSLGNEDAYGKSFMPSAQLQHLKQTATLNSLTPILDFKVADLVREESAQYYALCGVSDRSSMRVLRHGLPIVELSNITLPGVPSGIWTIPNMTRDGEGDRYIVISFEGSTMVLGVAESVNEVQDSGILATTTTLTVHSMGRELDSIVQIHAQGIRHIKADKRVNEWRAPGRKTISLVASNQQQLVVCIGGSELIYFELDQAGNLSEITRKDMHRDISCIEMAPVPKGRLQSRFLTIADYDGPIRVLSLERDNLLNQVAMMDTDRQAVVSLCILEFMVHEAGVDHSLVNTQKQGALFLHIGLRSGIMKRASIDALTGEISDVRTRLLGRHPVKFNKIKVKGQQSVLALSTRVWLCYSQQGKYEMVPLSIEQLDHTASLSAIMCPEGIVSTNQDSLKVFTIEKLGELFNQTIVPLNYTPRRFVVHPQTKYIISIESEHNYNSQNVTDLNDAPVKQEKIEDDDDMEVDDDNVNKKKKKTTIERPKAGTGKWRSLIRIINPVTNETLDYLQLARNEAAFSIACVSFHNNADGEVMLAVGCATDVELNPKSWSDANIHLYRFADNGKKLVHHHSTPVEGIVYSLASFQGKLICGVGAVLRMYELGKKRMLRKCENRKIPNTVVSIHSQGDRIIAGDIQESVHFLTYKKAENTLVLFADDSNPRFITSSVMLDYDTVAIADKFGSISVVRLPQSSSGDGVDVENEIDIGSAGQGKSKLALNGASTKVETIACFYVGETVSNLSRTAMTIGGSEVLVYTTLSGMIGALVPLSSREDVDFFATLEMLMRTAMPPLCGRDHLSYRSYYFPVKNVIDGELCEQFSLLTATKQREMADELSRSPSEILRKLEDLRSQKLI